MGISVRCCERKSTNRPAAEQTSSMLHQILIIRQSCTGFSSQLAPKAARQVGRAVGLLQTHLGKKYPTGGQMRSKGKSKSRASLCVCPLTASCEAKRLPLIQPSPKRCCWELHLLYHVLLLQLTLPQFLQQHKPGLLQPELIPKLLDQLLSLL